MEHLLVTSSFLHSIAYEGSTLEVRFKRNPKITFVYPDVPGEKHADLLAAESKGGYFQREIQPFHQGAAMVDGVPASNKDAKSSRKK